MANPDETHTLEERAFNNSNRPGACGPRPLGAEIQIGQGR